MNCPFTREQCEQALAEGKFDHYETETFWEADPDLGVTVAVKGTSFIVSQYDPETDNVVTWTL